MANTKIRVVNKYGKDVENNGMEQGEIIIKGSGVTINNKSHYKMIDGWLYTGDIGTIDENGTIKSTNSHQEEIANCFTDKIERAFNSHPLVLETAVITDPKPDRKESYHAFIVLQPNQEVAKKELINSIKENVAHATLLKITITFVDELPRTVSGKILKLQL